jgi:tetratricopeptide (TPR) repeat protein
MVRKLFLAAGMLMAAGWLAAGCGTSPKQPAGPPVDTNLERLNRAARAAFENGQIDQAAQLYRRALDQALMRAEAAAITDARYNLATCLMTMGEESRALEMVEQAQAELTRDGRAIPADVRLLQATILYRSGRNSEAWRVTDGIVRENASPPPLVLQRTYFLRGLIADAAGDDTRLREAIERMPPVSDSTLRADRSELTGRLAIREGRWDEAVTALDKAAGLRRQDLDYRRMAISLALSARACEGAGRTEDAARRYLEAGRSAALSGEKADAAEWLGKAMRLSEDSSSSKIGQEARHYLDKMKGEE